MCKYIFHDFNVFCNTTSPTTNISSHTSTIMSTIIFCCIWFVQMFFLVYFYTVDGGRFDWLMAGGYLPNCPKLQPLPLPLICWSWMDLVNWQKFHRQQPPPKKNITNIRFCSFLPCTYVVVTFTFIVCPGYGCFSDRIVFLRIPSLPLCDKQ